MRQKLLFFALLYAVIFIVTNAPAYALSELTRTDNKTISAEEVSQVRFREIMFADFVYKSSPDARQFDVVFKRRAKADNDELCREMLDDLDLEMTKSGDVVTIRLEHPKNDSPGIFKRIFTKKEWHVVIEVTGPRVVDMDMEATFSDVRIEATRGNMKAETSFSSTRASNHTGPLMVDNNFGEFRMRGLDGSFQVNSEFGNIDLTIDHLVDYSSASCNFGGVDIRLPRNSGAEFFINKSFGGVDFKVDGNITMRGGDQNRRILNDGGPRIDLSADFGSITIRDNISGNTDRTGNTTYIQDRVMPLNRGAWWKYAMDGDTLTLRVERVRPGNGKTFAKLSFDKSENRPFDSIEVCETTEGLMVTEITGNFFGRDLSGVRFDPPRLWLPYSDQAETTKGDEMLGGAVIKAIEEGKKDDDVEAEKAGILYTMEANGSPGYELKLLPGVGFTAFGSALTLIGYDLAGETRPVTTVLKPVRESTPPEKQFEEGTLSSITIRGTDLVSASDVEKYLALEKGRHYTRSEISDAVQRLPKKSKLISGSSHTIDSDGNLVVRIYEVKRYSRDWDGVGSFSRVAGVGTGLKLTINSIYGPFSEVSGAAQYHWANKEWTYAANGEKRFFDKNHLAIGGSYRLEYESNMEWAIPPDEAYMNAFLLGLDTMNYYQVEGGTGYISQSVGSILTVKAEYFDEDYSSLKKYTNWSVFNNRSTKEDNPPLNPLYEDRISGMRYSAEFTYRHRYANGRLMLSAEKSIDRGGQYLPEYTRFFCNAVSTTRYPDRNLLKIRVAGGYSEDELPDQKSFRLGGLNTLRGFEFGTLPEPSGFGVQSGGNQMFLANIDYFFGYDDEFRLVLFGDVGGVWHKDEAVKADTLRRDLGVGLVFDGDFFPLESRHHEYVNTLRVNCAIPVGPEPHVSMWTVNFVRAY
ncbi:outer membrane protein assembly factor [bacterium]|nr:outer membrane protein assembly factor [bacterium]